MDAKFEITRVRNLMTREWISDWYTHLKGADAAIGNLIAFMQITLNSPLDVYEAEA